MNRQRSQNESFRIVEGTRVERTIGNTVLWYGVRVDGRHVVCAQFTDSPYYPRYFSFTTIEYARKKWKAIESDLRRQYEETGTTARTAG